MSKRIRYSQDQWIALVSMIEEDGGFQAEDALGGPEKCIPRVYDFVGDHKLDPKERILEGCGHEAIFEVAYDPHEPVSLELEPRDFQGHTCDHADYRREDRDLITIDHSGEAGASALAHSAHVCAVCDGIGWWPRYAQAMEET